MPDRASGAANRFVHHPDLKTRGGASSLNGIVLRAIGRRRAAGLVALYGTTLLLSAILLFSVQPLFAKMVLPLLGGAPAVWNTCLVFFQTVLLGGYLYAHLVSRRLPVKGQVLLHLALIAAGAIALPLGLRSASPFPGDDNPVLWLLATLVLSIGIPFFVLSATAPLLQRWFSVTDHRDADDPYFLYAASNAGSLAALMAYPLLIEPYLRLSTQRMVWTVGYGVLLVLAGVSALAAMRCLATTDPETGSELANDGRHEELSVRRRLRWIALAAVPCSLMLSVTTHLTTDISPIPLLWVLPLALYVTSFVLVFARKQFVPYRFMVRVLPIVVLPLVVVMLRGASQPLWLIISLHLVGFFVVAMVCHGELARTRPLTRHLTEFYLWISVGGALGGLLTAIVAPLVFQTLVEYRIALVLGCLLAPKVAEAAKATRWLNLALPVGVGAVAILLGHIMAQHRNLVSTLLLVGVPALACFAFRRQPRRFALGIAALFVVLPRTLTTDVSPDLYNDRSFFGVYRVADIQGNRLRALFHGTTIHGAQHKDGAERLEPLLYFHRGGPAGSIFAVAHAREAGSPVAIIGLGTGALACYGLSHQPITFYEIDPAVRRIALDDRWFTFLRDCPASTKVVLGDGRLSILAAPDQFYELIIVDAFSSDAIPIHLLTQEAMRLYLTKLTDDGILALHISNRYLDLRPVIAALARDLGLVALWRQDPDLGPTDLAHGRVTSEWAVVARQTDSLKDIGRDDRWKPLTVSNDFPAWTDDFSNIVSLVRWR